MSVAQRVAQFSAQAEGNARAAEFLQLARALLVTRNEGEARQFLQRARATDRAREAFETRAAVASGVVTDSTWGGSLVTYQQLSDSFGETLRNSAFDRVLGDNAFLRVPPMARIVVSTAGMTAVQVHEANTKPATQLTLTNVELAMSKVSCFVVLSAELMRAGGTGALNLLARELRGALSVVTDSYFIAQLTTGLTAIPSSGSGSEAVRTDIRYLLDAVAFDSAARLYFIASPTVAKRLAVVGDTTGSRMFPELTPTGGLLDGVPLLTSDAAGADTLTLFDASQVAVAAGVIELDRSNAATLQIDTAPDSPPATSTPYVSLWGQNMSALRAERYLSVQRMRSMAVAQVSGVTGIGDSPS